MKNRKFAIKHLLFISKAIVPVIIILAIMCSIEQIHTLKDFIAMTIFIIIFGILFYFITYDTFFDIYKSEKKTDEILEKYFKANKKEEVIPLKAKCYSSFITNLTKRAKFYAIKVDDDKFKITVKFNEEEEEEFETIYCDCFSNYYEIKEEKEQ